MSRRTSRSGEPKRNSASAFAISVLPGPGRAEEEEDAERPRRVGEARLDHRDPLDDTGHGVRLLEDAPLEERANLLERKRRAGRRGVRAGAPSRPRGSRARRASSKLSRLVLVRARRPWSRSAGGGRRARRCRAGTAGRGRSDTGEGLRRRSRRRAPSCSSACRATAIESSSSRGPHPDRGRRRSTSRAAARRGARSSAVGVTSATSVIVPGFDVREERVEKSLRTAVSAGPRRAPPGARAATQTALLAARSPLTSRFTRAVQLADVHLRRRGSGTRSPRRRSASVDLRRAPPGRAPSSRRRARRRAARSGAGRR